MVNLGGVLPWLRWLPLPLVLTGLVTLAGVALGRIYHGPLLAQLVLGAAACAVAVSAGLRRAPAWTVAPASVLLLTGYVAWAIQLSARRGGVPGDLVDIAADALRNGIPRLLTAMIPVEPQPDTIVLPVITAWLAALAAAELAIRAGRVLLGYLPPALLYAGALYVVGPNAAPAVWPTIVFAALAGLGLVSKEHPMAADRRRAGQPVATSPPDTSAQGALGMRLAAGAGAGLAIVVALAAVLGPAVARRVDTAPVDPRRYVQPPQLDTLDENPLIRLSGWALAPEQVLFDVRLGGDPPGAGDPAGGAPENDVPAGSGGTGDEPGDAGGAGDTGDGEGSGGDRTADDGNGAPGGGGSVGGTRIRLAVLSDYDGVTWRVGATYRSAGRALPPAPSTGDAPTRTVRQDITVEGLSGRLLPAAATPRLVDGVRIAYDPDSGTMIRPEGLAPGVRYTVDSVAPRLEVNLLADADVPSGPAVARMLTLGDGVPEEVDRLARQLGADSGAPYQRALAIEQFLAEHYRLVADAPSGHAYPNLGFFLFGPRNGGGQRGTSEQFAAAYAVLARLLGLPTRVVVGFQAPGGGPVRAGDALAWPEVLFDGVGWVPFHPLPRPNSRPRPVEEDFRPKPETSTPPPSDAPTLSAPPTTPPAAAAAAPPAEDDGALSGATLAAIGGGALLLTVAGLAAAVPLLRAAQRRRRLSDPHPGRRVAGAWLEVTDALRLAGRPPGAHLTATEVAAYAQAVAAAPASGAGSGPASDHGGASIGSPGSPRSGLDDDPAGGPGGDPAGGPGGGLALAGVPGQRSVLRPAAPPLDALADLVNLDAFAGAPLDPRRADLAVAQAVEYVGAVRAARPWWRRVVWSLHPGPLRWHRRAHPP